MSVTRESNIVQICARRYSTSSVSENESEEVVDEDDTAKDKDSMVVEILFIKEEPAEEVGKMELSLYTCQHGLLTCLGLVCRYTPEAQAEQVPCPRTTIPSEYSTKKETRNTFRCYITC